LLLIGLFFAIFGVFAVSFCHILTWGHRHLNAKVWKHRQLIAEGFW